MVTETVWKSLTFNDKTEQVRSCLQQLYDINNGTHNLSGSKDQGRLAYVKKDLEKFIIDTAKWESKTHEENS